jgi:SsrA-binding protein
MASPTPTRPNPPRAAAAGRDAKPRVQRIIAENRKATHEYELLDRMTAGLALLGSEVKSLRSGKGNIAEAWIRLQDGQGTLMDAHIALYPQAHQANHEPTRPRRLLLKAAELDRLQRRGAEKGLSIIPLRLYFDGPWVKVDLALARGRKLHDKRDALKEKSERRDMQRAQGTSRG